MFGAFFLFVAFGTFGTFGMSLRLVFVAFGKCSGMFGDFLLPFTELKKAQFGIYAESLHLIHWLRRMTEFDRLDIRKAA